MQTAKHGSVKPVLVLGLGNVLLKDDGFGPALLNRVSPKFQDRDEVEFLDGGTIGLGLLHQLSGRSAVVIFDAFRSGRPPGSVVVHKQFDPLEAGFGGGRTAHEGSASGLLAVAALTGDLPERIAVVGIEPAELSTGEGLSPQAAAGLREAEVEAESLIEGLLRRAVCV